MIWWLIPVSAAAASSWCRGYKMGWEVCLGLVLVPARELTNWSFHWMFSFPTPADKQSPGARETTHFSPLSELLRTLNKEGHFKGGTLFQRGGRTPGQGIFLGMLLIVVLYIVNYSYPESVRHPLCLSSVVYKRDIIEDGGNFQGSFTPCKENPSICFRSVHLRRRSLSYDILFELSSN